MSRTTLGDRFRGKHVGIITSCYAYVTLTQSRFYRPLFFLPLSHLFAYELTRSNGIYLCITAFFASVLSTCQHLSVPTPLFPHFPTSVAPTTSTAFSTVTPSSATENAPLANIDPQLLNELPNPTSTQSSFHQHCAHLITPKTGSQG